MNDEQPIIAVLGGRLQVWDDEPGGTGLGNWGINRIVQCAPIIGTKMQIIIDIELVDPDSPPPDDGKTVFIKLPKRAAQ